MLFLMFSGYIMAETAIPTVEGLDPESPDYVSILEDGLKATKRLHNELGEEIAAVGRASSEDLISRLKDAGYDVQEAMKSQSQASEPGIGEINMEAVIYAIGIENRQQRRAVEDIVDADERERKTQARAFNRRDRAIMRANKNFSDTLKDLTEVETLHEVDNAQEAHFFVVGEDGVYVDILKGTLFHMVEASKTDLDPDAFGTPEWCEQFKQEINGFANAYVVRNPTQLFSVKMKMGIGIKKKEKEKRGEKEQPVEGTPGLDYVRAQVEGRPSIILKEPYGVPAIDALHKDDPDYVEKLDAGYQAIKALEKKLGQQRGTLTISVLEDQIDLLDADDKFSSTQERREAEDIVTAYQERIDDYFTEISRRERMIARAEEDAREAIFGLSKIEILIGEFEPQPHSHLYIVRGDEVYESHCILEKGEWSEPMRSVLNVEIFTDAEKLAQFKEGTTNSQGNAFLIVNPSKVISVEELSGQAQVYIGDQICDKMEREFGKNPITDLMRTLSGRVALMKGYKTD